MSHTPTPWSVDGHNLRAVISRNDKGMFDPICFCECNEFLTRENNIQSDIANAQFIVKAVNSYEALRDALEEYVRVYDDSKDMAEIKHRLVIGGWLKNVRSLLKQTEK